jgi:hypothetical protein
MNEDTESYGPSYMFERFFHELKEWGEISSLVLPTQIIRSYQPVMTYECGTLAY